MTSREIRNRQFLTDLFSGPFRGHAIIVSPPPDKHGPKPLPDYTVSKKPVRQWLPQYVAQYHTRVRCGETFDDDSVPYVGVNTNTGIFAAAFGCPIHVY